MTRAWTASLLLHLLLAGALLPFGISQRQPKPMQPVTVHLVHSNPPEIAEPATILAPEHVGKSRSGKPPKPLGKPQPISASTPPRYEPRPEPQPPQHAALASTAETFPLLPATTASVGSSQPSAPAPAAAISSSASSPSVEPPTETYLSAHFGYIRDRVMASLRYPLMARRQGWSGQVMVEFTILMTGKIRDLKVVESSGFSILDQQALRAVEAAEPFPAPPTVATITLPINFQLH